MRRTFAGVILLLVLVLAMGAYAKDTSKNSLLDIEEHVLDNGMRVLFVEDHSAPIVSYQIYYNVGSRNERPGITGMSHMFEHMMFRGSTKYAADEHGHIVKAHGGRLNASTYYDRTMYYENISSDNLELVVHLEAERQANLKINDESFIPENKTVQEERRQRIDNSLFGSAQEQLRINAFNAHPYNWSVVGWAEDIANYRMEDLQWFHKTYYAPNNATIILVGDFDPEEAMVLIKKYHGPIPSQPIPPVAPTVEPPQRGERRINFRRPAQLPFILAGYHIPAYSHKDMPALDIAQKILSDGETSRIYSKCVYEEQVAAFAGGYLMSLNDPGLFVSYIGVNAGREMDEAEASLFSVIEGLAVNAPTERELQKAKNQLEADYYFGLQTIAGKGNQIGEHLATGGDYKSLMNYMDAYLEVTAEDVARVVKKYFVQSNRTTLILIPDAEFEPVDLTMTEETE